MGSSKSEVGGGPTPFVAPVCLVSLKFRPEKSTPSTEADLPLLYFSNTLAHAPLAIGCPPTRRPLATISDSLLSELSETSETETPITESGLASADVLVQGGHLERESAEGLPAFLFGSPLGHSGCELEHPY